MSGHDPESAQARQQQAIWETEVLPRLLAENAARQPWACWCGRGLVENIHGCSFCFREAADLFEASLLADGAKGHKRK